MLKDCPHTSDYIIIFTSPIGGIHNMQLYMYRSDPISQNVWPPLLKNVLMKIQKKMINSTLSWKRISLALHTATFTSPIGGIHNIRTYIYIYIYA